MSWTSTWSIANGENLAAGAGLTPSLSEELLGNGVDVITSGNHIWDKREMYDYLDFGPAGAAPHELPGRRARPRLAGP